MLIKVISGFYHDRQILCFGGFFMRIFQLNTLKIIVRGLTSKFSSYYFKMWQEHSLPKISDKFNYGGSV